MLARTDSRARALVLLVLLSVMATAIGGRLAFWHVVEHDRLTAMAADQLAQVQEIPAERGVIVDARGQLLAASVQVFSVYATPPQVRDPDAEATILAGLLQMPKAELISRLSGGKAWVWLRRRVQPVISDTIRVLALPDEFHRCRGKRWRLAFFNLAARVVNHAGATRLRLAGNYTQAGAFIEALTPIRRLPAYA